MKRAILVTVMAALIALSAVPALASEDEQGPTQDQQQQQTACGISVLGGCQTGGADDLISSLLSDLNIGIL